MWLDAVQIERQKNHCCCCGCCYWLPAVSQDLITLLPDVGSMLYNMNPATLAQLTQDTAGIANKLVSVRGPSFWGPRVDIPPPLAPRGELLIINTAIFGNWRKTQLGIAISW